MAEFKFEGTAKEVEELQKLAIEAGLVQEPFEEGDYVVAKEDMHNPYTLTNAKNMALGQVTAVDDDGEICVKVVKWTPAGERDWGGRGPHTVNPRYFRKATKEEMPDPRKLAFEAAGREENEFKPGDLVKTSAGELKVIAEVEPFVPLYREDGVTLAEIDEDISEGATDWRFKKHVDLVAPVESRVDKYD